MKVKSVLLIEDDDLDAAIFSKMLAQGDHPGLGVRFQIARSTTLKEGLALAARASFDAILLDLNLPDSAGIVTFEILADAQPKVPVVILSGAGDEMSAQLAVEAGAQDFVGKDEAKGPLLARALLYAETRKKTVTTLEAMVTSLQQELEQKNQALAAEVARRKSL